MVTSDFFVKINISKFPQQMISVFTAMPNTDGLFVRENVNLLLTEREGRTGEYWPEVVAVRTERSEVRTKTTEGQYSPYDRFHGNGPYGEIPTKKEPICSDLPCHIIS